MKHCYIQPKLVKDFSNVPDTIDGIIADLQNNQFTNIYEDEYVYIDLAALLHDDLLYGFANYRGYIEKGMNLRMFAELRKSAIIPTDVPEFFIAHSEFNTIEEVKQWRIKHITRICDGYTDEDWQYYMFMKAAMSREKGEIFNRLGFDFDDNGWLLDTPEGYWRDDYIC